MQFISRRKSGLAPGCVIDGSPVEQPTPVFVPVAGMRELFTTCCYHLCQSLFEQLVPDVQVYWQPDAQTRVKLAAKHEEEEKRRGKEKQHHDKQNKTRHRLFSDGEAVANVDIDDRVTND